ncbi:hypothetical protein [Sneathiella sp.]|nr:hypothetical protein [Sneathiella sp.]MDF2367845.1 hypothetical protein [Sneathiella sp.]
MSIKRGNLRVKTGHVIVDIDGVLEMTFVKFGARADIQNDYLG